MPLKSGVIDDIRRTSLTGTIRDRNGLKYSFRMSGFYCQLDVSVVRKGDSVFFEPFKADGRLYADGIRLTSTVGAMRYEIPATPIITESATAPPDWELMETGQQRVAGTSPLSFVDAEVKLVRMCAAVGANVGLEARKTKKPIKKGYVFVVSAIPGVIARESVKGITSHQDISKMKDAIIKSERKPPQKSNALRNACLGMGCLLLAGLVIAIAIVVHPI